MKTPHPRDIKTGRTLETWDSWVDEVINDARERGDFDNLPGHGQVVRVESNPLAGDSELGYHVLKNANMLPHWMELSKDVEQVRVGLEEFLARSVARLNRLRERACAAKVAGAAPRKAPWLHRLLFGASAVGHRDNQGLSVSSVEHERRSTRRQYLERAAVLDKRTQEYNAALSDDLRWLERPRLLPRQAELTFDAACPPLQCEEAASD